ncbi:toll/interleukin-1 receptor domain-containing protein [Streptomyces decoyicus]|uniref:toll/interleukin-1 receptor domain-containing protein n=1 Tax=Streptomyces decoyicus TaxID=249567 RepID=UPI0036603305
MPTTPADVFINYRTTDEPASAALIGDGLSQRFGADRVFRDGPSLSGGERYAESLIAAVRHCSVLLAVIGARWLDATDPQGHRALENPDDWIRREIIEAFDHGVRVIPVLVSPLQTLPRHELPWELAGLADVQFRHFVARESVPFLGQLGDELVSLVPGLAEADRTAEATGTPARRFGGVPRAAGEVLGTVAQVSEYHDHQIGGTRMFAGDGSAVFNGSGGTVVNHPQAPVHTGPGSQNNGPQFSGNHVNYVAGTNHGGMHQRNDAEHPPEADER